MLTDRGDVEIYIPVKTLSLKLHINMFRSLFIISLIVFAKSETEKTFSTKDEQIIRKSQMVLNERNFNKVVGKGHTFVKFYAPWCGHCQMMEEDWKDVGKFVENNQQLFKGKDLIVAEVGKERIFVTLNLIFPFRLTV